MEAEVRVEASNSRTDVTNNVGHEEAYDFPLPTRVLMTLFSLLPVQDMLRCRMICKEWNSVILTTEMLDLKSCFVFDGRKEDGVDSPKISEYMSTSDTKSYPWSHLKLRRALTRHCSWLFHQIEIDPQFSSGIYTLELLNSTLNWLQILQLLSSLPNLHTFTDRQDVYCWDYATFNSGIEEAEDIPDTAGFQQLSPNLTIANLHNLFHVKIHRSQLIECTTYLKILHLASDRIRTIEIDTDQNFAPQRGTLFYQHLQRVLVKTGESLRVLRFPYKLVCPTYDFRVTDEHRLFREFLTYIVDHEWAVQLRLPLLSELSVQFGTIPLEGPDFLQKLAPFLLSLPSLSLFQLGCIHLESGTEGFVSQFVQMLPPSVEVRLGIFMNDSIGLPEVSDLSSNLKSLSVQTFRDSAKEIGLDILPFVGQSVNENLKELQYFSKNHTFRSFNLQGVILSFPNLTHLNLVDHNARLETRHSCEALATIEDSDLQALLLHLPNLFSLQLIGNMTFLTDSGLTGLSPVACKRMLRTANFSIQEGDVVGLPLSHFQSLRFLVLRGLGIKVTDVTARAAFLSMPVLSKVHLYGSHQISAEARSFLSQIYNVTKGCDLQL